jgi:CDK-activating kinase assembly factor MAT1
MLALPNKIYPSLNRREEEFDSKRAYDDFLEQREEIIANLVCRTDVAKTEAQLQAYAQENMQSIKANQALEEQEATSFQRKILLEQEEARMRQQIAREEYENERREQQATREDFLTRLASGSAADAAAIAREGHKVHLKKSSARRSEEDRIRQKQAALRGTEVRRTGTPLTAVDTAGPTSGAGLIKGLRKIKTPEPEKPYDPFMGLVPGKRDYYTQLESYPYAFLDKLRSDTTVQAGGYDLQEYYSRTLLEAFAGLGCFVQEEVAQRDASSPLGISKPAATEGAAMAAVGKNAA